MPLPLRHEFDGDWIIDHGTIYSDAIRQIISYYMPEVRLRVDSCRYASDRRVFRTGEDVWQAVEDLAAVAGMEVDEQDGGLIWVRPRF